MSADFPQGDRADLHRTPLSGWTSVLRQSWRTIVACTILAASTGYVSSTMEPDSFEATATLLFDDPNNNFGQQLFGSNFAVPAQDADRRGATNLRLVSLRTVASRTAKALGQGYTAAFIDRMVDVESAGNSNLIAVTATTGTPAIAARVANTFARQYVEFRRESNRSNLLRASAVVRSRIDALRKAGGGPELRELSTLDDRLSVLATLQTGNAELVQTASVPQVRASPRPARSAVLGGMLGLLVGVGLVALRRQIDHRLRTVDELEGLTGWPVLASIPLERTLRASPSAVFSAQSSFSESFRLLRARLRYFNVDREIRSLLVVSGRAGEGKTTTLLHLARVCAQAGDSVVIVEADLRRPTLAARLGLTTSAGLAEMLGQHLPLASVVQTVDELDLGSGFSIITAGATPPNPAELLESARMAEMIRTLRGQFDIVLLDSPPTTLVSDTMPLMHRVDGVLVVARFGVATQGTVRALERDLRRIEAPVLGVVANGVSASHDGGYSYDAYYGSLPAERTAVST